MQYRYKSNEIESDKNAKGRKHAAVVTSIKTVIFGIFNSFKM